MIPGKSRMVYWQNLAKEFQFNSFLLALDYLTKIFNSYHFYLNSEELVWKGKTTMTDFIWRLRE